MGLGDLLGQMLQQGAGSRRPGAGGALGGGNLDAIFAQLQGALGGAGAKAKEFAGREQVGGLTGGQIGGIGAIAGALLGGGAGGAVRGGAMAVLGTLALNALRSAQASASASAGSPSGLGPVEVTSEEVASLASPAAERLMVTAMISAAKADGKIDKSEMEKIIGKIGADSITEEERGFVMGLIQAPLDIQAIASQVTSPAQAAAVYAASLYAIHVDTDQERAYLAQLAAALNLDEGTVTLLEQTSGVPA